MSNISAMKEPYKAAIDENWEAMIKFFDDKGTFNILYPMTVAKDTAFHIAVRSKKEEPLKQLLERVENPMVNSVFITNARKNTVLHVAALNNNFAAVKLLVESNYATHEQLVTRNGSGQTPLFKAASFGSTKVVRYLASRPNQMNPDNKKQLRDEHRTRNDDTSILHAAVRGEHFGTALELLKLDEGLANLKTSYGMTSLHLLTNISTLRQKHRKLWLRILYFCIPLGDDKNDDANNIDEDDDDNRCDEQVGDNHSTYSKLVTIIDAGRLIICKVLKTISNKKSIWKIIIGADWLKVRKIWKEKRKHKFAFELARELIKKDDSWQKSYTQGTIELYRSDEQQIEKPEKVIHGLDDEQQTEKLEKVVHELDDDQELREIKIEEPQVETPLFAATKKGKIEIVKEILKEHPQAVEHVSHKMQNILHVAASYRQREVFELVKQMQIPTSNLILGIDAQSYTVLHHAADTKNYNDRSTGSGPPAYKLQEELEWFESVKEIMPSFYTEHRDKKDMTAKELFKEKHKNQLNEARKWIKDTSQSCSAVAVLIATVVFAAAYTVPGGNHEKTGSPNLGKEPIFLFFTIMDVISLSCSLTSVVTFLSMLTFPFGLKDFRVSLPRRLTIGFTLLFISVATTMLAFTSTIFLIVRENKFHMRIITLICCTVFFPVSVLALLHFPLFGSFINASKDMLTAVCNALPCILGCLAFLRNSVCRLLCKKKDN